MQQYKKVIDLSFENPIHRMAIRWIFLEWIFAQRRLLEDDCENAIHPMTKLVRFFISYYREPFIGHGREPKKYTTISLIPNFLFSSSPLLKYLLSPFREREKSYTVRH